MHKNTIRNLIIFSIFAIGCGWVAQMLNDPSLPTDQQSGTLIWLATPLLISMLLRAFGDDGWKDFGINPAIEGNIKWYLFSIFIYPIVAIIIIFIGLISGVISTSVFTSSNISIWLQGFLLLLGGTIMKNILEEFAFRGYLAPKVYSLKWNRLLSHTIVGLVWGAWHIPFLVYVFSYLNESAVTLIPRLLLGTIAASIVYGEIRIRTNSVWPAFFMHTIGGSFIGAFLLDPDILNISERNIVVFSNGVEGILTILLFTVAGYFLMKKKV